MIDPKNFWLDPSELVSAIPSKHVAGSILFFANTKGRLAEYALALRVDHSDQDGDVDECLLWIDNDPWDQGALSGFMDGCRDHHLNDKQVLGLAPDKYKTTLQIDFAGLALEGDQLRWQNAIGWIAAGPFGFRLVGAIKDQYGRAIIRLIDPHTWSSNVKLLASHTVAGEWLRSWRLAVHSPATGALLAQMSAKRQSPE